MVRSSKAKDFISMSKLVCRVFDLNYEDYESDMNVIVDKGLFNGYTKMRFLSYYFYDIINYRTDKNLSKFYDVFELTNANKTVYDGTLQRVQEMFKKEL